MELANVHIEKAGSHEYHLIISAGGFQGTGAGRKEGFSTSLPGSRKLIQPCSRAGWIWRFYLKGSIKSKHRRFQTEEPEQFVEKTSQLSQRRVGLSWQTARIEPAWWQIPPVTSDSSANPRTPNDQHFSLSSSSQHLEMDFHLISCFRHQSIKPALSLSVICKACADYRAVKVQHPNPPIKRI